MEREFFEKTNRCVSVTLADPADALYSPEVLARYLGDAEPHFDVVELDTILLGEVKDQGVIKAWPDDIDTTDWLPSAKAASTIGSQVYGVPHLMCSEFIISRDKKILEAATASDLVKALQAPAAAAPSLVGDAAGSWTLPSLYLDAWRDTYPKGDVAAAISTKLDRAVVGHLKRVLGQCDVNGSNPCITPESKYDDKTSAAEELGRAQVAAAFGYSERLHFALRAAKEAGKDPESIGIAPAPLGDGNSPLLFTDSFVIRRNCNDQCAAAAREFVSYVNGPDTMKWYLFAEECAEEVPPRYLIPATRSAFELPEVKGDKRYSVIRGAIESGAPFPNHGLYDIRKKMRDEILKQLSFATQP
ncbi:extracellular solute-binding protein [Sorangium sp. So ce233]|uniref:extracellular solute-binding protein n=1 Tax=Sorangium sp. So ce233 TaxID=3133290 RepID=UPI003F5F8613